MDDNLLRLDVEGMSCAACVASVERIVGSVDSVKAVAVNLAMNSANIQLNDSVSRDLVEEIVQAIDKGGFSASQQNKTNDEYDSIKKDVFSIRENTRHPVEFPG